MRQEISIDRLQFDKEEVENYVNKKARSRFLLKSTFRKYGNNPRRFQLFIGYVYRRKLLWSSYR